jgi:hypothetical protein
VRENFILDDRRIILNVNGFDRKSLDFRDQDPTEGVGDGGIGTD